MNDVDFHFKQEFDFKQQFDLLSTHTPEYEFTVPYIMEHVVRHLPQHSHFVDIGAGRGNLLKPLAAHFAYSTVVEPNTFYYQEILDWAAREKYSMAGYNQDWLSVNMHGQCADFFLMSHVLYYVPKAYWLYFINKAYELLNPGGRIVIILNSLTNDVTRLYKEFLQADEWWDIAAAEFIGTMLRQEGYSLDSMKFQSNIYAETVHDAGELIDFLLLGRTSFDSPALLRKRELYAETHLKCETGYVIQADAGMIIIKKEV